VIETPFSIAVRMALITGYAIVGVPPYSLVSIIHSCLVVLMAINAGIYGIVTGIGMAVGAIVPFALVLAGIDREILTVVIESRRFPGNGIMAILTGDRKLGGTVRRVQ